MEKFVVLDLETSGLNFYESDFEIKSAALVWNDGTAEFIVGEKEVGERLAQLGQTPILVYNLSFELGCILCRYPELSLNFTVDVARLTQLWDGGGDGPLQGLSLKRCVRRILNIEDDYTESIYSWIRHNIPGVRRGKEGVYLSQTPYELLKEYNIADSKYTLQLYQHITDAFKEQNYDWTIDHDLYKSTVNLVVSGKIQGIHIDREQLQTNLILMQKEVDEADQKFHTDFENEITQVRQQLLAKKNAKLKKKQHTELPPFNVGSKTQLKMLFVDLMGIDIGFRTASGNPSFKSIHLPLYGSGGELLAKRGKKLLVVNQATAMLNMSEKTGRWHPSLKLTNVRTGRLSGGN